MKTYTMITIGDVVTDAFIKLKDAAVHCSIDTTKCELCVRFGDKVPYESVEVIRAVGNSANAAVSASRLGLSVAFISTIGNDEEGKLALKELEKNGVSTEFISTNNDYPTNYHYVLSYEVDRTILIKHAPFPYTLPVFETEPQWIYLSSLGEHSLPFHTEIAKYLESHPKVKLAFQPGTYQIKFGIEVLAPLYNRAEVFVCNVEEAQKMLKTESHDIKELMTGFHTLGPKIVCITDGPNGSYASDGTRILQIPIYPDPKPPVERTGAGDAFTSTFVSALALGETMETALLWAPINSMSVVQEVGAQKGLLSKNKLLEWLSKAPENYKVTTI